MVDERAYTCTTPLKIATPDDVYTDGSLKRGEEFEAGAGVFFTSSGRTIHIKSTGKTSILRAGLVVMSVALQEWDENNHTHRQPILDQHTTSSEKKGDTRGLRESAIIR
jgi:hypothetical protein